MAGAKWVSSVDELVAGVRDGERISVSGFHFVRAPIAQLKALVNKGVKHLTYVAWGGGLPLEILLSADAVDRLDFCFSSFDIFGLAPRFRRALEQGTIEVEEWTALAFTQALEAEARGLSYTTLQAPLGSELYSQPLVPAPVIYEDGRAPMATVPRLEIDTFLLHAQRADLDGNVEIAGARGCDLSSLFPAKRILVTVEEQVPNGMLSGVPHTFIVPRSFVSALAVAPLGAYPTSCLPYYSTDYSLLRQLASRKADEPIEPGDLEPARNRSTVVRETAQIPAQRIAEAFVQEETSASERAADASYSIDELMACCIARTIDDESICSVGSVSPLATAAYLLAKRLWAPNMCLISYNGGFIDVPFRPMAMLASEVIDFKLAVSCTGGDETYHWYYQRGMITHEVVSAAQIDRRGATNNVFVRRRDGSMVRLPGQGGMADVANMHRDFFLYLTRHNPMSMVESVDFVSAKREAHRPEVRRAYGYQPGATRLITNLGQFQFDVETGELVLTHLHPGITLQDLQAQTGFTVQAAPVLGETEPPTPEELRTLRVEVDPLGIRRLEFIPSAERSQLIDELFEREERLLRTAAATTEAIGSGT